MKSKLFSEYPEVLNEEAFGRDVKILCEISDSSLKRSPRLLVDLYYSHSQNTQRKIDNDYQAAAKELDLEVGQVRALFRIAGMFISAFLPNNPAHEDDVDALAADLTTAGQCEVKNLRSLSDWLTSLRKLTVDSINTFKRQQDASKIGSPHFSSIVGNINFRPIFDRSFRETDGNIESYNPELIGFTPVALVSILVDEGPIDAFHFQADRKSIDKMIAQLQAIKKEFEASKGSLSFEE